MSTKYCTDLNVVLTLVIHPSSTQVLCRNCVLSCFFQFLQDEEDILKIFCERFMILLLSGFFKTEVASFKEKFEDTKGVIRSRKSKKDKQRFRKHYTKN